MKSWVPALAALFLLPLLFGSSATVARAETVIEGTVPLPPPIPPGIIPGHYGDAAKVNLPDPPVAVVYLEGDFSGMTFPKPKTVQVAQQGYQIHPGVMPVQVGTTVEFPNLDDTYHNIFSLSKAKRFDLGRYRKGEKAPQQVFDTPGVVKLFCEIHLFMRGTILVLDSPYFTKTDPTGHYRLSGLPPGKYTVKVWIDNETPLEKPIEISPGQTQTVDF